MSNILKDAPQSRFDVESKKLATDHWFWELLKIHLRSVNFRWRRKVVANVWNYSLAQIKISKSLFYQVISIKSRLRCPIRLKCESVDEYQLCFCWLDSQFLCNIVAKGGNLPGWISLRLFRIDLLNDFTLPASPLLIPHHKMSFWKGEVLVFIDSDCFLIV